MARPIHKILFIEPRAPREHIFSRVVIPRLGCLLLGTILQEQGKEVKVVIEEMSTPDYRTLDFHPDLVCISSISSTAPRAYELGDFYRQQGLPAVLGGAHPSFLPLEGLEHADYVICGEFAGGEVNWPFSRIFIMLGFAAPGDFAKVKDLIIHSIETGDGRY